MEELFKANIANSSTGTQYNVVFDHDEYIFQPLDVSAPGSFSLRREHDEWHGAENISPETRQQAIDALENYLLKQH
jgi:hypothetical protein